LGSYLAEAGFTGINTTIEIIRSDLFQDTSGEKHGLKAFLDLLSFGAAFADRHPELVNLGAKAKLDTARLAELPYAWAAFGLFVVTGVKSSG
jgi:hypothetical protein